MADYVNAVISGDHDENSLPVIDGTMGPRAIDIQSLYATQGLFAFDPGFRSTASCSSSITYVDGDKGVLLYRGYPIEELAEQSNFEEVAYLLMFGELPSEQEYAQFTDKIGDVSLLHDQVLRFYRGFRRDAHPMAIMVAVVGALSAFYHYSMDIDDPDQRVLAAMRLVAKMPMIAAASHTYHIGRPIRYPRKEYSYAENMVQMMCGPWIRS
jgi:citrate synthase